MKAALKEACGREQAPEELRRRVTQILQSAEAANPAPPLVPTVLPRPTAGARVVALWRRLPFQLVAAVLVLAMSAVAYVKLHQPNHAIDPALLREMVATHDLCCSHSDHQREGLEQKNFAVMGDQASEILKHAVLATSLEDGWKFSGIALCPVGGRRGAHLIYHRGGERLSLFSVAAEASSPDTAAESRAEIGDRRIAARLRDGVVFGTVAHGAGDFIQTEDLAALLDQHLKNIQPQQVAAILHLLRGQEPVH